MAQPKLNLLLDQPPRSVFINGKEWAINSNFYIGIKFEMLIQDKDVKGYELCARALSLYYPTPPDDPGEALSKALWFYSCGRETPHAGSQGDSVQAYSFDDDDNLIYAAFLDQYGVDLSDIPYLHWWKFQAMFENLRPDHKFCQVMHYRTAKIDRKWPKAQRDFYTDMKKRYAIRGAEKKKITLAERDKQWKDYIKHRLGGGTNV